MSASRSDPSFDTDDFMTVHLDSGGVLHARGEVDGRTASRLAAAIAPLVRQGGLVQLHLGDITFFSAAGYRVLQDAATELSHRGRLVVVEPSVSTRRVIGLFGLREAIDIEISDGRDAVSVGPEERA